MARSVGGSVDEIHDGDGDRGVEDLAVRKREVMELDDASLAGSVAGIRPGRRSATILT